LNGGVILNTFIKISICASFSVLIFGIGFFIVSGKAPIKEAFLNLRQEETVAKEAVETQDLPIEEVAPKAELEVAASSKMELMTDEPPMPKPKPKPEPSSIPNEIILDVPLLLQMDAPRLYNGCEVTSLAMLLQFHGLSVTKNELATKITRVPLNYQDGKKGNPNVGFVGNMEDGPGLGVYHEPIFKLAQSYVNDRAEDLTNQPFSVVIEKLAAGSPVWVIITSSFAPTSEIKTWNTPQGPVEVTFKMHSVVITGYDQESIYINDPYGGKNKKVNKENFIKAWEQMGSQAIVINK
jgi:uncharacterized protein YvpB